MKISVQVPIERWARRLGWQARQAVIWIDRVTRSQNHMLGQPRAMTIILQQSWLRILFMIFAIRGVGGKVYPSMSSHDRLRASRLPS